MASSLAQNSLEYLKSGGFIMLPIVLATFGIWFCYIDGLLSFRAMRRIASSRQKHEALAATQWRFTMLGSLIVATPLMGLLGTVIGMTSTFNAISANTNISVHVADGIRLALVTTQAGLMSAIPGTFGLAHLTWLKKRIE